MTDIEFESGMRLMAEMTGKTYLVGKVKEDSVRVRGLPGTFTKEELEHDINCGKLTVLS